MSWYLTPALALQTDLSAKHGGSVECINRTAADAVFLRSDTRLFKMYRCTELCNQRLTAADAGSENTWWSAEGLYLSTTLRLLELCLRISSVHIYTSTSHQLNYSTFLLHESFTSCPVKSPGELVMKEEVFLDVLRKMLLQLNKLF